MARKMSKMPGLHVRFASDALNILGRENGRHFPDDFFEHISLNESVRISIKNVLEVCS